MMWPKPTRPKKPSRAYQYRKARERYLNEHPVCERCLVEPATEVHHKAGRMGDNLLDESTWAALGFECHRELHDHPEQAYEDGWLIRRNNA